MWIVAEGAGFEPAWTFALTVFKTSLSTPFRPVNTGILAPSVLIAYTIHTLYSNQERFAGIGIYPFFKVFLAYIIPIVDFDCREAIGFQQFVSPALPDMEYSL